MNKRLRWVIIACAGLVICAILAALTNFGGRHLAQKKIGYCFDLALDEGRDRLYVAAGSAGLHVLDVTQGALRYLSTYHDMGYYRNLKLSEGRAYLADSERGLVVLDIAGDTPLTMWEQGDVIGMGIQLVGDRAYLAAGQDGLYIFGLNDPDRPELLGQTRTAGAAWDVWADDGYAYVADVDQGLTVVEVSSAEHPHAVGFVTWDEANPLAEIVRGEGHTVYVAAARHGLIAIDVSDPTAPVIASIYPLAADSWAEGLAVQKSIVCLAVGNKQNREENGLLILDARDLRTISAIGKLSFPGWVEGVHAVGDVAYVANTWSGVRSVDIRDPSDPRPIDRFTLRSWVVQRLGSLLGSD